MDGPSLEAIVLYLDDDGIRHLSFHGRQTVLAPWDPDLDPHEAIVDAVAELGLTPIMVHSTSWRVVRQLILLTVLVVVEAPRLVPDTCEIQLVTRAELARGRATGPAPRGAPVPGRGARPSASRLARAGGRGDPPSPRRLVARSERIRAGAVPRVRSRTGVLGKPRTRPSASESVQQQTVHTSSS